MLPRPSSHAPELTNNTPLPDCVVPQFNESSSMSDDLLIEKTSTKEITTQSTVGFFHRHFASYSSPASSYSTPSDESSINSESTSFNDANIVLMEEGEVAEQPKAPTFKKISRLVSDIFSLVHLKDKLKKYHFINNTRMFDLLEIELTENCDSSITLEAFQADMESVEYMAKSVLLAIKELERLELNINNDLNMDAEAYTKLKKVIEKWLQNKKKSDGYRNIRTLLSQIWVGMVRDFVWGVATYRNLDWYEGHLGSFWGPTFTQLAISMLPTFAAARFNIKMNTGFSEKNSEWIKQQLTFTLASLTAIPVWNGAQWIGNWVGEKMGFEAISSGYFSSLFSGVAETIWQNALIIPGFLGVGVQPIEVAFNTLGGAIWQIVYQANMPADINHDDPLNGVATGLEISGAVAMSTLLMTLLAWKIMKYKNESQLLSETDQLLTQAGEIPFQPELREKIKLLVKANLGLFSLPAAQGDNADNISVNEMKL